MKAGRPRARLFYVKYYMRSPMTSETVLKYETNGPICTITLCRPDSLNAFNGPLRAQLLDAANRAEAESAVRVIILTGEGRGFSAGADLSEPPYSAVDEQLLTEYMPFLNAIVESSKIWIAAVNGPAAGIASALAMNCDYVFMAEEAYIYLAFAAISLVPDGAATWHLLQAMGYRRAFETIVEGRKVPAEECLSLGIANAIRPASELMDFCRQRAEKLALGAPLAQASAKRILRQVGRMTMREAIELEANEQLALTQSDDFRNAVKAFFEKKKPVFEGK